MRFFPYSSDTKMGKLWNLLHAELVHSRSDTQITEESRYEHIDKIVESAVRGSFDVDQEEFFHSAYEKRSKINDRNTQNKKAQKELHIITPNPDQETQRVGYGNINEHRALNIIEEDFDRVESNETVREGILALIKIREQTRIIEGIDPVVCLVSSLNGVDDAMKALNELCEVSPSIKETVGDILSSYGSSTKEMSLVEQIMSIVEAS